MIISRTPFRISFLGGGTDYPIWYRQHGGSVIAATIDKYCYLTCRYLPPFFEHRILVAWSKVEACKHIDEVQHPAVREILRYLNVDRGLAIHHDGDLPARSGMGSSSSFTVGLLNAMYALKGQAIAKSKLAKESIHIEQNILQETVGSQDQILAAYGGLNHVNFLPNDEFSVRPIILNSARLEELNAHLMLFYTGIKRTASNVAGSYVDNLDTKRQQLRILQYLVEEGVEILSSDRDLKSFGELLHEAWQVKRSLGDRVSNSQVDQLYETARQAGAIGGKLTGAGGGGFMLLFAPPERQAAIKEQFRSLIHVPFQFEFSGSQIVFFDPEQDYTELDRLRTQQQVEAFRELEEETKDTSQEVRS